MYGRNDRRIECAGMAGGTAFDSGIRSERHPWIVAIDADAMDPACAVQRLRCAVGDGYFADGERLVRRRTRQPERSRS